MRRCHLLHTHARHHPQTLTLSSPLPPAATRPPAVGPWFRTTVALAALLSAPQLTTAAPEKFVNACLKVAPTLPLWGDRVVQLGEHLASPLSCPVFAQGIGSAALELVALSSKTTLAAVQPLSQNAAWDAAPRGCYTDYASTLCSAALEADYEPSAACQTHLNSFLKVIASCAAPDKHCASFADGLIHDPSAFCRQAATEDVDRSGQPHPITLADTDARDCAAFARNYNVCREIGVKLLKLEPKHCVTAAWRGYCKLDVGLQTQAKTDELCREVVMPGVLFSAVRSPATFQLVYAGHFDDFCRRLRGEYAARLTARHADALVKAKAGYDILQSCDTLLSYLQDQFLTPMAGVRREVLNLLQSVTAEWTSCVTELRDGVLQLLDTHASSAQVDTQKLYILANDTATFDDLLLRTSHLVDWFLDVFRPYTPERDAWRRPVLPDLRAKVQSYTHLEDQSGGIVQALDALKTRALMRWRKYPLTIHPFEESNPLSSIPSYQYPSGFEIFTQVIHLGEVLTNKTVAAAISTTEIDKILVNIREVDVAVAKAAETVCEATQAYNDRYCTADGVTLDMAMAFTVVNKLIAVQLQLI